jgi:hypothetical protein
MIHPLWLVAVGLVALLAAGLWQRERRKLQDFERQFRRETQEMAANLARIESESSQMVAALGSSPYPLIVVDQNLDVRFITRHAADHFGPYQHGMSLISLTRTTALEQIARDAWEIGPEGDLERTIRITDKPYLVHRDLARGYL